MNKFWLVLLSFLLLLDVGSRLITPAFAQTANGVVILGVASSVANCSWPTQATVTNGMAVCPVSSGGVNTIALAVNGGAFTLLTGGVASFNGRTGAVVSTSGDYKFSDLTAQPTSQNCTTAAQTNTGLVTSGCVYK